MSKWTHVKDLNIGISASHLRDAVVSVDNATSHLSRAEAGGNEPAISWQARAAALRDGILALARELETANSPVS